MLLFRVRESHALYHTRHERLVEYLKMASRQMMAHLSNLSERGGQHLDLLEYLERVRDRCSLVTDLC
jgi:hypothetical protein